MINIRELNKITKSNDYLISLQSNVINSMNDCFYVNVINAIDFFYQWLIKIANKHKFIIVSYKNNEQFNVTIMSFRNNLAYVQRQIDVVLRQYRVFARVYVDDIVVFNKTLKKHLKYLTKIFELFRQLNIVLKFFKTFLNYFIVVLLEQKIDNFDFITTKKKLKIIFKLQFLITLKQLKIYLSLTS